MHSSCDDRLCKYFKLYAILSRHTRFISLPAVWWCNDAVRWNSLEGGVSYAKNAAGYDMLSP